MREVVVRSIRARVLLAAGDRSAAESEYQAMEAASPAVSGAQTSSGWQSADESVGLLDEAFIELADPSTLRAAFDPTRQPAVFRHAASPRLVYANIGLALGEDERASEVFREMLDIAEREATPIIAGRCHQGLAEVATRRGEPAEAMHHLDAASELFQRHGAKLYLDQVIAKKLELQGASGDVSSTIEVLTRTVEAERPDLASRVAPDGTVTILFSDIEGSTALNVELGDDRWMELLGEHNRLVSTAIA